MENCLRANLPRNYQWLNGIFYFNARKIRHEYRSRNRKNLKADCIDDFVDLDYEGRFLRRKKLSSNTGEEFLVELPETHSLSENDS